MVDPQAAPASPAGRSAGLIRGGAALWVLALVITNAAAMRASISPLQELVKADLKLDDVQISLVQGLAASLPIALLSIPIGRMVDRSHRVRLLLAMSAIWTLGALLTALSHGFILLFVARMLAGLGALCALPAAISIAADLSPPERRGRALLLLSLGTSVGTALAFILAGWLFTLWGGAKAPGHGVASWRAIQMLFAAASAILTLPLILMQEPARREVGAETAAPLKVALAELWARRSWLGPLFVGQVGVVMADTAASVWAAPILTRTYHLQPDQFAGWMGLVVLIPGVLGAVIGGVLADFGQRRKLFGGVLFGAVVASALAVPVSLFAVSPTVLMFALTLAVFLFCGAVAGLITATAIAVLTPNETRGITLGAFVVLSAIVGLGLAPTLVAVIGTFLQRPDSLAAALAITDGVVSIISFIAFWLSAKALRHQSR